MAEQLSLNLPHRTALDRDSFLVSGCNAEAVALIDEWPNWRECSALIVGAAASGKSHLAAVWSSRAQARQVSISELSLHLAQLIDQASAVIVEGLEQITPENEEALFHLINAARHDGFPILMTSQLAVSELSIETADLKSRLFAVPHVLLGAPDDALLGGLLSKLMRDRQLQIDRETLDYIVTRIERRCDAVLLLCEELDRRSLNEKRPITRRLAAEALNAMQGVIS